MDILPSEAGLESERKERDGHLDAHAGRCCELALMLEETGDYHAAASALGDFWHGVGLAPDVSGLTPGMGAAVILMAGVLTSRLGSIEQIEGLQSCAKDLISRSQTIFEELAWWDKVAEAQAELAYCYLREGNFNECRIMLKDVLKRVGDKSPELRTFIFLRSAILERCDKNYSEALRLLLDNASLFEMSNSHAQRGKFHVALADIYKDMRQGVAVLGEAEALTDRALVEYSAASFHFEQAGHERYRAAVENNLSLIFIELARYDEAYQHLERARSLFLKLNDKVHTAEVDETRARVFYAQGHYPDAETAACSAVGILEQGDSHRLLAEALLISGKAQFRMGKTASGRISLTRVLELAESLGSGALVCEAVSIMLVELNGELNLEEKRQLYCRADDQLAVESDPASFALLRSCARLIINSTDTPQPSDEEDQRIVLSLTLAEDQALSLLLSPATAQQWQGFSLGDLIIRIEEAFIRRALIDSGGRVSAAARMLGWKHHQSLRDKMSRLDPSLMEVRNPVRRVSLIKPEMRRPKRVN